MADDLFEQRVRVRTEDYDGDEWGNEWRIDFVLYETQDDCGHTCFDIYEDDGKGNGNMIARGYHAASMRNLTLRLGTFVEWEPGVGRAADIVSQAVRRAD